MKNLERKRERYLKDSLPKRLGGLAASLGRVSSSARYETSTEGVAEMMEESQYYIEWTAAETKPEVAAELVDIQVALSMWRRIWIEAQRNKSQRALLSFHSKKWSDQVLDYSGLLSQERTTP
ncbi:MAG: hypothetical protein FJ030_02000 [Chloroflexi bacterium]|nr:hypothetical protein [Chloroflexota bacterium]